MHFRQASLWAAFAVVWASETLAFVSKSSRSVAIVPFAVARTTRLFLSDVQEELKSKTIQDVSVELRGMKQEFDEKMAAATTLADAEALRREYMGKKGPINAAMGYMRLLPNDDKPKDRKSVV